jgi:rRNA-processing protein FCF1
MRFLLDANFLMVPGKFKADVFRELEKFGKPELFTIDHVVKELSKVSKGKSRDAFSAKLGLFFIQQKDIGILESQEAEADAELLRLSKDYVVCTQDKALTKKILRKGGHVVFLRQRKYLEMK